MRSSFWSTATSSASTARAAPSSRIHVDAAEATVTAKLSDGRELTRILSGDEASPLRASDGGDVELPSLPILRHSTINAFMEKSGGDKRKALLQILDLDALNDFRGTLRKAVGLSKDKRKAARERVEEERAALESMREGEDLLDRARGLAKTAEIGDQIASEDDLDELTLKLPAGRAESARADQRAGTGAGGTQWRRSGRGLERGRRQGGDPSRGGARRAPPPRGQAPGRRLG